MVILSELIKLYKYIIFLFLFFTFIVFTYFDATKNDKIETYIKNLERNYELQYSLTYDSFEKLSQNSFFGIINKPNIYNNVKNSFNASEETQAFYRKKLYDTFISDYNRLTSYNFKQVQFHFPDNTSFLRMHTPQSFGDNLSNIRYSVAKVNKELKPVNGFEIGKYVQAFRFVYPLFDNDLKHIGSVEASISSDYFENIFEEIYSVDVHFLLKDSLCKEKMIPQAYSQYIKSNENNEYFYKENTETESIHYSHDYFYSKDEKKLISEKMKKGVNFSFLSNDNIIVYFKAIKNIKGENAAYLVIYTKSKNIQNIKEHYFIIYVMLVLFIGIFFLYILFEYKKIKREKERENLLNQKSRLALVGEMITSISHQWRQPLSVISTSASGLKVQKDYGVLSDDTLEHSLSLIIEQTQYLSKTIEDFRNFFQEGKEKRNIMISELIEQLLLLQRDVFETKKIQVVKNIIDFELFSYIEDLKQVLLIILKNSIEVLNNEGGIIFISSKIEKDEIIITIKDTGGGIAKNVIKKIFEPYFTTKHESVGTGLGLYMAYEIINKTFNGSLIASNKEFSYKFKTYTGAEFKIVIPKDIK